MTSFSNKVLFLFLLCIFSTLSYAKGLILYIEGFPGSGRDELAKELREHEYFKIRYSPDDYAAKHKMPTYKTAVLELKQAIKLAKNGDRVIFDSFLVEDYFVEAKSSQYDVLMIGVWCPLACLKERFDKHAEKEEAYKNTKLVEDYHARYEEKSSEEILKDNGNFRYSPKFLMKYDLFLNSEKDSTKALAEKVFEFLKEKYPDEAQKFEKKNKKK